MICPLSVMVKRTEANMAKKTDPDDDDGDIRGDIDNDPRDRDNRDTPYRDLPD